MQSYPCCVWHHWCSLMFSALYPFTNHRGSLNSGKNNTTCLGLTSYLCMSYYDCNIDSIVAIFFCVNYPKCSRQYFVPFQTHTPVYQYIYNTLNSISYFSMCFFLLVANIKFLHRLSVNMIHQRLCYCFRDEYCRDACKFVLHSV